MSIELLLAPPLDVLLGGSTPDMVSTWLDRVLLENAGGQLLLGYHLDPGYALESCLAFHDELAQRWLIEKDVHEQTIRFTCHRGD